MLSLSWLKPTNPLAQKLTNKKAPPTLEGLFTFTMKKILTMFISRIVFAFSMLINYSCHSQKPNTEALVNNPKFNQKISSMLNFDVPIMGVHELSTKQSNYVILDARDKLEFDIAHIKGAKLIGYEHFDKSVLNKIPKDSKIVVYCSIGYRSEKIALKLKKLGYSNVFNLYGSIFEWVNQGNAVYDKNEILSHRIHTYNKEWSKWVDNCKCEKVW